MQPGSFLNFLSNLYYMSMKFPEFARGGDALFPRGLKQGQLLIFFRKFMEILKAGIHIA